MFTSVPRDPVDNLMMTVFMRSPRQSFRDMLTSTSKMLWERVLLPSVPLPPGYVDTPLWGFVEASVSPSGNGWPASSAQGVAAKAANDQGIEPLRGVEHRP